MTGTFPGRACAGIGGAQDGSGRVAGSMLFLAMLRLGEGMGLAVPGFEGGINLKVVEFLEGEENDLVLFRGVVGGIVGDTVMLRT